MVVADDYFAAGRFGGRENPLDTARRQRQWPLAQHVDFGFQGAKNVGLVQVVRRGDHYRVHLIQLQQILDVGEHVGDLQPLCDRAGLGAVVVAERNELRSLDLGEHRQVRELGNRSRPDEAEADGALRFGFLVANRRFGQR